MTTVSSVEMSVGLRSAARLLVLRSREDLAVRRESVARDAYLGNRELTATAHVLDGINSDPLCLACEAETATGRGLLLNLHTCGEM